MAHENSHSKGILSHDANPAQYGALDMECMSRLLPCLASERTKRLGSNMIAIDGKTLRRHFENSAKRSSVHVVTAFAAWSRLAFSEVGVDKRSNEITMMPKLPWIPTSAESRRDAEGSPADLMRAHRSSNPMDLRYSRL